MQKQDLEELLFLVDDLESAVGELKSNRKAEDALVNLDKGIGEVKCTLQDTYKTILAEKRVADVVISYFANFIAIETALILAATVITSIAGMEWSIALSWFGYVNAVVVAALVLTGILSIGVRAPKGKT